MTIKTHFSVFSASTVDHIRSGPVKKPLYLDFSNLDWINLQRLNIRYNTVSFGIALPAAANTK